MRWLLSLAGRLLIVGLGVYSLWFGAQLSGVGAALSEVRDEFRVAHRFHSRPLGTSKLDAGANVLEVVGQSFGVLFLVLGGAAVVGGLFPWRRVLGGRSGSDP
jgi:hypothetical protein